MRRTLAALFWFSRKMVERSGRRLRLRREKARQPKLILFFLRWCADRPRARRCDPAGPEFLAPWRNRAPAGVADLRWKECRTQLHGQRWLLPLQQKAPAFWAERVRQEPEQGSRLEPELRAQAR